MKTPTDIIISNEIKKAYLAYFDSELSGSVAVRVKDDLYAVLFPSVRPTKRGVKKFEAVIFNYGPNGYELSDDGVIFDSIESFNEEKTEKRFF